MARTALPAHEHLSPWTQQAMARAIRTYIDQAISRATNLIVHSRPGTRHPTRLKASRLLGAYIGPGLLTFEEAYELLAPVVAQHTAHFERSMKTIADGLRYGMQTPVTRQRLEEEWLVWCSERGLLPRQRSGK
jgi:hypothetical protein